MKKFKDIISLPSEALQAMVDGLLEQDGRPGFVIDMDSFASFKKGVCFGCAAVCATQKLSCLYLTPEFANQEWEHTVPGFADTKEFEMSINHARCGSLMALFSYFDIDLKKVDCDLKFANFRLHNDNWRSQLPLVREHIEKLRAAGY